MNKNAFDAILNLFNKLNLQQKVMLGVMVLLTVILMAWLLFFLNEPNYGVLFSNLAQEDASKVVEQLTNQKIPYKIDDNGKVIKVPKDKVYETRLSLAGKGIPSSGIVGYEIFDKSTMGMSEFMQKLNYKRALEGELSRTIDQQEGVEAARVMIVIPQKTVFKEDEKEPTASVVLRLKKGYTMSSSNINAILNLVSSSVEGLSPNKVTLLDTRGRLLSKESDNDILTATSSKQYEIKQSVENYLAGKAQRILDNVLGFGNAIVQVNAELNFNQVEKTMEMYDPDSQVAISEQNVKTENNGKSIGDTTAQVTQNSTTNYEINKTIQKVVEGTGNIKKLSVAAVINDVPKEVKKGKVVKTVYEPRSQQQMNKLEQIIKNAVGVDANRQDQFSIVNISFENKQFDDDVKPAETSLYQDYDKWINFGLMIIAIIASILILKNLMGKLKKEKIFIGDVKPAGEAAQNRLEAPTQAQQEQLNLPAKKRSLPQSGDIEDEISDDAVRSKMQHEKIVNYVAQNPSDAAKLINAWLHEDEL